MLMILTCNINFAFATSSTKAVPATASPTSKVHGEKQGSKEHLEYKEQLWSLTNGFWSVVIVREWWRLVQQNTKKAQVNKTKRKENYRK